MMMMKYTDDCGDDGDDEEKGWRSLLARPPIGGTTTNAAPLPASMPQQSSLCGNIKILFKVKIIHPFLIWRHYSAKASL